jgi:shikimate dehydrogenase
MQGDTHGDTHGDMQGLRTLPAEWRALALDDGAAMADALVDCDVIIQATPVGTGDPDASPIPLAWLERLPPHAFVFDMVYRPPETALIRAARARGLRAVGGLVMLLYQGAAAFTLWTGREAPLAVMRTALGLVEG